MGHNISPESPANRDLCLADKRKSLLRQTMVERRKLESLIIKQYDKGAYNLGLDIGVLKQSHVLDRLLFEIMMLENTEKS